MRRSVVYTLHFWPPYKHAAHYTDPRTSFRNDSPTTHSAGARA